MFEYYVNLEFLKTIFENKHNDDVGINWYCQHKLYVPANEERTFMAFI